MKSSKTQEDVVDPLKDYQEIMRLMRENEIKQEPPGPCSGCSNHPSNGGSGICFCTLGQTPVSYSTEGEMYAF